LCAYAKKNFLIIPKYSVELKGLVQRAQPTVVGSDLHPNINSNTLLSNRKFLQTAEKKYHRANVIYQCYIAILNS